VEVPPHHRTYPPTCRATTQADAVSSGGLGVLFTHGPHLSPLLPALVLVFPDWWSSRCVGTLVLPASGSVEDGFTPCPHAPPACPQPQRPLPQLPPSCPLPAPTPCLVYVHCPSALLPRTPRPRLPLPPFAHLPSYPPRPFPPAHTSWPRTTLLGCRPTGPPCRVAHTPCHQPALLGHHCTAHLTPRRGPH